MANECFVTINHFCEASLITTATFAKVWLGHIYLRLTQRNVKMIESMKYENLQIIQTSNATLIIIVIRIINTINVAIMMQLGYEICFIPRKKAHERFGG